MVQDDLFVDAGAVVAETSSLNEPGLNTEWMNDAIDFVIDSYSSDEQKNGRYITTWDQRTATYVQIQYRFGGQTGPSSIVRISSFNPAWAGTGDPIKYSHVSVNEAYASGLLFEAVTLDADRKAQEWLIPWRQVGAGLNKPEEGKKIGFIAGYNDIDPGETEPDILRWKNRCDAYCNSDNWGDLEFGGSLDEAAPVRRHLQKPVSMSAPADAVHAYTLTGRVIETGTFGAKTTSFIARYIETDGQVKYGKTMRLR
jgi:hypothetical protein